MQSSRRIWIGLGAGAGYLLWARAGHARYEQLAGWWQRATTAARAATGTIVTP